MSAPAMIKPSALAGRKATIKPVVKQHYEEVEMTFEQVLDNMVEYAKDQLGRHPHTRMAFINQDDDAAQALSYLEILFRGRQAARVPVVVEDPIKSAVRHVFVRTLSAYREMLLPNELRQIQGTSTNWFRPTKKSIGNVEFVSSEELRKYTRA